MGLPTILISPTQNEIVPVSKQKRPTSAKDEISNRLEPTTTRGHKRSSSADIRWSPVPQQHLDFDSHRSSSLPSVPTACRSDYKTCDCKDKSDSDGLHGNQLKAFYTIWTMKNEKDVTKHRQLEPPSAWKRHENYRTCGCVTRTHLSSLTSAQSRPQCQCNEV